MKRGFILALALSVAFLGSCVFGQEQQQSLGDVARKQRKENASTTQHASHVITNDDIPKKTAPSSAQSSDKPATEPADEDAADPSDSSDSEDSEDAADQKSESGDKETKEQWLKKLQAAIRRHKKYIAALKDHLAYLEKQAGEADQKTAGGAYSCGNLYREACENIRELQAEIAQTKSRIETAQKELEQAQEEIRKMGYGNSVYDPD